jgi:hypothetical protein
VIMVLDELAVETDLAAGRITCPRCGGKLRPWSYATRRPVRMLDCPVTWVRPRRGRCEACHASQVLLPSWCLPRRADSVQVVLSAMLARERGLGYGRIAKRLGRSVWTVRSWLRRLDGGRLDWLRRHALSQAMSVDPQALARESIPATATGAALSALGAAAVAYQRRIGQTDPWALIGVITSGRLLAAP